MQGEHRLLFDGLDGHRRERMVPGRLEQRLGIGAIGLVAITVAGDVRRVQELDLMTVPCSFPPPVVGRATGLEQHLGGRLGGEEAREGGSRETSSEHHHAGGLRDGHLEDGLGEIDADLYR